LQGRQAPDALHPRARQDSAAAHLGHVRAAPARAADRHQAGTADRAAAVRGGLTGEVMAVEVILREHVDHLGRRGEIVKVAPGYARNYLLPRSEEHTSELQSRENLVCRLLLEKKKIKKKSDKTTK